MGQAWRVGPIAGVASGGRAVTSGPPGGAWSPVAGRRWRPPVSRSSAGRRFGSARRPARRRVVVGRHRRRRRSGVGASAVRRGVGGARRASVGRAGSAGSTASGSLGAVARRRRRSRSPGASAGLAARPRCRRPSGSRWATASNSSTEPATAALSDPTAPRIGIRISRSQRLRTAGPRPWPSLPTTSASGPRRSAWRAVSGASASAPATRSPRPWRSARAPARSSTGAEQQVLDGAGRGLDRGRRERRLATGREDDAVDAGRLGAAQQRAHVLRVLERVEDQHERRLAALRGPGEDVVERRELARLDDERDALVAVEARRAPSATRPRPRRSGSAGAWRGARAARAACRRCGTTSRRIAGRRAANASSTGRRPATSSSSGPSRSGGGSGGSRPGAAARALGSTRAVARRAGRRSRGAGADRRSPSRTARIGGRPRSGRGRTARRAGGRRRSNGRSGRRAPRHRGRAPSGARLGPGGRPDRRRSMVGRGRSAVDGRGANGGRGGRVGRAPRSHGGRSTWAAGTRSRPGPVSARPGIDRRPRRVGRGPVAAVRPGAARRAVTRPAVGRARVGARSRPGPPGPAGRGRGVRSTGLGPRPVPPAPPAGPRPAARGRPRRRPPGGRAEPAARRPGHADAGRSAARRRVAAGQPRPTSPVRRQRWPSRVSSTATPRAASSSRSRSDAAQSRAARAAARSSSSAATPGRARPPRRAGRPAPGRGRAAPPSARPASAVDSVRRSIRRLSSRTRSNTAPSAGRDVEVVVERRPERGAGRVERVGQRRIVGPRPRDRRPSAATTRIEPLERRGRRPPATRPMSSGRPGSGPR